MFIIGLIFLIIVSISIDAIIQYRKRKEVAQKGATSFIRKVLDPNALKVPSGILFDKTHTWAYMEKDGNVQIGINDLLQHITGPATSFEMKGPGEKIRKGEPILSIIQKGKKLNIYAPISGTITENNCQLSDNSKILNYYPYSDGWIYKIEPSNWIKDTQVMIMAEKAKDWMKQEYNRFKDFFTMSVQSHNLDNAQLMMQDGGSLLDHALSDFGPEIWDDFQTNVIDKTI